MARTPSQQDFWRALLATACGLLIGALPALAQQSGQNDPPPPASAKPSANAPVLSGKGPLRLPEPAAPQPGVARSFTPTEKVRVDAEVDFPADI